MSNRQARLRCVESMLEHQPCRIDIRISLPPLQNHALLTQTRETSHAGEKRIAHRLGKFLRPSPQVLYEHLADRLVPLTDRREFFQPCNDTPQGELDEPILYRINLRRYVFRPEKSNRSPPLAHGRITVDQARRPSLDQSCSPILDFRNVLEVRPVHNPLARSLITVADLVENIRPNCVIGVVATDKPRRAL